MIRTVTKHFILILILFVGFLYFYNINWGAPYYFHPDERNIASAVSQMQFPNQLNPKFFAYGSLPIYTIFATGLVSNIFIKVPFANQVSFEQALLLSRVFSALFATALIPIIFAITAKLAHGNSKAKYLATFLSATSVGMVQFSHFGTFELWLTFFSVLLFWACLHVLEKKNIISILLLGICFGVLFSVKVSSLALLPLPLLAIAFSFRSKKQHGKRLQSWGKAALQFLGSTLLFLCVTASIYGITNPYVFLDTADFVSSMHYESGVGFNTIPVFYTQGFYDTVPIIYQLIHVYPFLINPLLTILLIPSFCFLLYLTIKTKNVKLFFLEAFFFVLFVSQSILFIKWTRYLLPTLPFLSIVIAITITTFFEKQKKLFISFALVLCGINLLFALSYFITVFGQTDTRIQAFTYAKFRIPQNASILSETYDIGITPFNTTFPHIVLFNTYDLDADSPDANKTLWNQDLVDADYIILPSQRVLQTRILNKKRYPIGNEVYSSLRNGSSGFKQIYQTPCDIFCQITYLGDPIYHYEQTVSVFDRPTVMIFQKNQ